MPQGVGHQGEQEQNLTFHSHHVCFVHSRIWVGKVVSEIWVSLRGKDGLPSLFVYLSSVRPLFFSLSHGKFCERGRRKKGQRRARNWARLDFSKFQHAGRPPFLARQNVRCATKIKSYQTAFQDQFYSDLLLYDRQAYWRPPKTFLDLLLVTRMRWWILSSLSTVGYISWNMDENRHFGFHDTCTMHTTCLRLALYFIGQLTKHFGVKRRLRNGTLKRQLSR